MAKVVTMGEIMLRLSPPGYQRFAQASEFEINYGGAEANVAVSLAQLGHDVTYISKIPSNAIGEAAIATLKKSGVDCRYIARGGKRLGIYFLETGPRCVLRALSMTERIRLLLRHQQKNLILYQIFDGAELFHVSGITPVLSEETARLTQDCFAKGKGTRCDNIVRLKLPCEIVDRRCERKAEDAFRADAVCRYLFRKCKRCCKVPGICRKR